jgi:type IV pilus assembly protein PilE
MRDTGHPNRDPRRSSAGYTLIELVVAMVIAAVLVAIAVPSYMNYSLVAHRTDAKSALLDLASLEERYYTVYNAYTTAASAVGYGASAAFPLSIGSGYYQINTPTIGAASAPTVSTSGTPATFSVTAQAIGMQVRDTPCFSFTVNSAGVRTATASTLTGPDNTPVCWNN